MSTNFIDHLLTGDHASRPAFGDVPQGTLYACSDHGLIYQSDGTSAWSTWATLGGSGGGTFVRAVRSATQALADSTWVPVAFTAADTFDSAALHDPGGANPSRVSVPGGATYAHVEAHIFWPANAVGNRYLAFARDGTQLPLIQWPAIDGSRNLSTLATDILLVSGIGYIELHAQQDSGGSLNLTAAYLAVRFE